MKAILLLVIIIIIIIKITEVSCTPGEVAPATYAGRPSARGPGPARRRGRTPNRLGTRLGNRIIISLIFRRVLLQLVFSLWLYISVIRTLRYQERIVTLISLFPNALKPEPP